MEGQTLRKQLSSGGRNRTVCRVIPTKSVKHTSGSRSLQTSLNIMPNIFPLQPFVAVSGNLGGKAPVVDNILPSDEQKNYPTTLLDEKCI